MNFIDAIAQLQARKCVKRVNWEDGYCCLMPDQTYIWRVLTKPQANVGNFMPMIADLLADDWAIYDGLVASAPVSPPTE